MLCLLAISFLHFGTLYGEDTVSSTYANMFDDGEVSWKPATAVLPRVIQSHALGTHDRGGAACEQFIFNSPQELPQQRIALDLPKALMLDELQTGMWVISNCASVRMLLRVQFPHHIDPSTNLPLTIEIPASAYTDTNKWQYLKYQTTDDLTRGVLIRVRSQLSNGVNPVNLDTREMYVDQMIIEFHVPAGQSGLWLDDLSYGPVVTPPSISQETHIEVVKGPLVSIKGDRVLKDQEPFFPVFTLYHGESLDDVRKTGVNTIWIPDYTDEHLLTALSDMGIGAIARPPMPLPDDAIKQASAIRTVPAWTSPIWAWMLGEDIPTSRLQYVSEWTDQVRDADRIQQRPIFAGVQGNERAFHRDVSFLGTSQFTMHSDVEITEYYERLKQIPNNALLGKPMFTFVSTEPSSEMLDHRPADATLPIVEPELIMLQAYAAVAAGYKGIGFWKQIPFNEDVEGLNERILAIRLFTQHIKILEPWLANGRAAGDIRVLIDDGKEQAEESLLVRNLTSRWDRVATDGRLLEQENDIRATRINTNLGILVLPVWYGEGSQCVPGTRAAKSIRMVVSGCNEPLAWEVTPTRVSQINLESKRIPGGLEIQLKDFDQQSAIVITREQAAISELTARCNEVKRECAGTTLQLAELKLKRVEEVHAKLVNLAPPVKNANVYFESARIWLERARQEYEVGHDHESRLASQKVLQQLRTLQRAHWDNAMRGLTSISTSLEVSNFQTLPDHWALMQRIEIRTSASKNLIPSGTFENEEAFLNDGWFNASELSKQTQFQLRIMSSGRFLSMSAYSTPEFGFAPSLMLSPEIPVLAGDLLAITGQVQIPEALDQIKNGLMIYECYNSHTRDQLEEGEVESTGNQIGAIRLNDATNGWKTFTLYRTAPRDGFAHLCFQLDCPGTIALDNIQVHKLSN